MSYKYIETKSVNPNKGMMFPQVMTPEYIRGFEEHKIYDAGLKGGAKLHRFKNHGGVDYSAIYIGDDEWANHERSREGDMIRWWNESGFWK